MQFSARLKRLVSNEHVAEGVAVVGGIIYLIQSWLYAHAQTTVLDEGSYLAKGYLFATGKYWPYQDYGPWSNHMPFAFLIPGFIQVLFGPGLRTGRYFAIFIGCLFLLGLWIVVKRFGGKWWAAGAVLAIALNPALIKIYSMAISEGLIACMLVWVLVLILGESRPVWQVLLGSILAGVMALTRLNLVPVLPLIFAYIFWQHGKRVGWWALLAGGSVLLLGHLVFWPGIMRLWAAWIPVKLFPFLARWRPPEAIPAWDPNPGLNSRLLSFLVSIRYHFVSVVGVLITLILWPKRQDWRSKGHYRASVFLVVLFFFLFAIHAWATLGLNPQSENAMGKDYCVFCLPLYLGFFSFTGLILVAASAHAWRRQVGVGRQLAIVFLILALLTGIGYAAFVDTDDQLLELLEYKVPRMKEKHFLPGTVELGTILQLKTGLGLREFEQMARRVMPTIAGFLTGIVLFIIAGLSVLILTRTKVISRVSLGTFALFILLLFGLLVSPAVVLGGGYKIYDCSGDNIKSYEAAGNYLARVIPAGSLIYWKGGDSAVPLLYLRDVEIFPAQINNTYTYRDGGDPEALEKYGFWNNELREQWVREADFVLVEERRNRGWLPEVIKGRNYGELQPSPPTAPCRNDTRILIFERK